MKRALAILLAFAMILSLMPTVVLAQEQTGSDVGMGQVHVEGTNSFGMLISDGITQALEETENGQAGYGVTGLEVNGNIATVTYDTLEEAVLVVAIYTEDGTQLLTTGKKTVSPEETKAMVTLPEFQEPYFLAEAFLLDIYDYSPLCRSFDTPMYTSDMQKLLDSTVEDYDPERVFQLSQDKTTNFAVFTDSTVIIEATQGCNTLVSADDQNYQYIFENADAQITGLTAGAIVAYLYGEEEMLLFKVASVSTQGTTATVTGAQMEVQEIFAYMKLENSGDASQIDLDASTADAGVTFVGMSGGAQTRAWEGESTKTLGYEYSIDGKYENETADGKVDGKVELKGSVLFTLETKLDYYISLDRQFVKFEVTGGVALGMEVAGELNINALKLGDLKFSPVTGVIIGFEPQLKLGFSGKLSFSTKVSFTMGMQLEHRKGGHFTVKNLCKSSKPETSVEFEGEIFIGIDLHPIASIVSDEIAKLELTGLAGIVIKGKLEKGFFEDDEPTEYMVHGCELCLTGEILAELKISVKIEFLCDEHLSCSEELVALRFKLADFYYSYDHGDLGWGACPHYEYQIRVLTLDEQVNPVGGVNVTLSNGTDLGKTNKNGLLLVYLPEGNYTFRANIGGQPVVYTKYINYYGSVTLTSNEDYWAYLREMEKLQIQPDSALTTSTRDSGTCGNDVSWTLYESGLLRLTGSGSMDAYYEVTDTPWEEYLEDIKSVHVSGDVTSVGNNAFYGCTNLEKVILDDKVVHLGTRAFYGCTALKQVKLPVSLATDGAFYYCGNIEKVQYSCGSSGKMAPRGAEHTDFNHYASTLEYQNSATLTTVIFDEDITEIADNAFNHCSALTTVKLPSSLVSIGADAFYDCAGLEDIALPEGLEHLGDRCFSGCEALKEITIPSTVSQIPQSCFSGCSALTELELPPTVTELGYCAFHGCTGLTKVSLPVDLVTDSVFSSTGGVTQIHYTYGSTGIMAQRGIDSSYDSNFYTRTLEHYNREHLTTVTFDEGISALANRAFYNCSALTSVKLPSTLRTVGDDAFRNCTALESIHLPKVTGLGANSFSGCKSLTGITLPSTLTVIPSGCFQNCVSMTELILPDVVTSLGKAAFAGCTELVDVTLPVDLVTDNAFGTTGKITRLHYTIGCTGQMAERSGLSNEPNFYTRTLEYANREVLTTVIFDAGITTVANRAFTNCVALTSVTLPSSIHTIGDRAFNSCTALKTLKLPKGKLTLGDYCFNGCTALEGIELPEGLTALGANCFNGCKALASVNFPSTLDTVSSSAFANCTALTQLEIPKTVTTLKENAFHYCTGLTHVTIPVDLITDNAFTGTGNVTQIHYTYGNTGKMAQRPDYINGTNYFARTLEHVNREVLTTVTFDPKITTVADRAFSSCVALTNVTLPTDLTSIGEYAFSGCTALESILLPEGLTALGTGCFSGCKALSSVNFPSTLTAVPSNAFNNCTALTQLEIPKTVTTLAEYAFHNCTGLTQLTIPVDLITDNAFTGTGNVTQIHYTYGNTGKMAQRPDYINATNYYTRTLEFLNREKLTTVIFDLGITTVANWAFNNCSALAAVTFRGDCPSIGQSAFKGVTAAVSYPQGNETYLPDLMGNYGGTLTWVPYEPVQMMSCEAEAVTSDTVTGIAEQPREIASVSVTSVMEEPVQGAGTVQGSVVQREAAPVNQVYDGTNRTEFTQDKTAVQVSSFTGLVPGAKYLMLAVVSLETEDLLAADNLLFIDQGVAAEDGTLTFRYVQRVPTDIFYVFVCGASDQNLEDAQVVLPEMTANGAAQALRPSVSYDGQLLVEEVHYIITEGAVFTDGGTYTATIRGINQYSGTKTFSYTVAAPAASTPPTITLKYPTVSFEDEIVMNIYYAASNLADVKEMGLITYTSKVDSHNVGNAEKVIPGYTWSETDGFYFSTTAGIAAKDLGDTIYFAVYAKLADGTYTYTSLIGYSPKTYAYNLLKTGTPGMKTLVAAMLNYGAAAQSYFNYKTDALVNADMTDAQKALVAAYSANMISAVTLPDDAKKGEMVGNGGYKNRYPTISFEGAFCINYYFVPSATPVGDVTMYVWNQADFNAAKTLSKSNATKAITMTLDSNGEYAAVVDGIAAKDLDSGVYVAFCYSNGSTNYCSGVIGYSIGAYCKNQASKTGTIADLAAATAVYAYYAKQLFA